MRTLPIVSLVVVLLAGCQGPAEWQSIVLPTTDRMQAFNAARDVLSQQYIIATADPALGKIQTRPLAVPRRGKDRRPGAYITSGQVQNYRRTVTCWITQAESSAHVRLTAALQRESTSQAATLIIGTEGGDRRQAGAEPQWRHLDDRQATYWADVGRDTKAEADLLQRIRRRVGDLSAPQPAEAGPSPKPPAQPEKKAQ